tara:strand:+ start:490 stop:1275 length:786 start_codon:yes stop_codon:yes gene_type:complete
MLKIKYLTLLLLLAFCSNEVVIINENNNSEITAPIFNPKLQFEINVDVHSTSFWKKDQNNQLVKEDGKYVDEQNSYVRSALLSNKDTLFIIMDPWIDMDSEFLNKRHKDIVKNKINPLVDSLIEKNFEIIVFTNDCERRERAFNCNIGSLQNYVDTGTVYKFYHDDWNSSSSFNEFLKINNVNNIVYLGFNSNQCIINRHVGMIPLRLENGNINFYIIPEASAAIEFTDTWDTDSAHESTLQLISSWLGELLYLQDLISKL